MILVSGGAEMRKRTRPRLMAPMLMVSSSEGMRMLSPSFLVKTNMSGSFAKEMSDGTPHRDPGATVPRTFGAMAQSLIERGEILSSRLVEREPNLPKRREAEVERSRLRERSSKKILDHVPGMSRSL